MSKPSVTLDATFVVAYCTMEPNRYAAVVSEIVNYANRGYSFHAPGVIVAECLHAFCKMVSDSRLTPIAASDATRRLVAFMQGLSPTPNGDAALALRSEQIRATYSCRRSSDSIYLALAEQLAADGWPDLLTYDAGQENQAKANAPSVNVRVFTP